MWVLGFLLALAVVAIILAVGHKHRRRSDA
jgi:predicted outer membrane lipoprotein